MTKSLFGLILASVLMSSVAQVVLKAGMSHPRVLAQLETGSKWDAFNAIAASVTVWSGLMIYFASALVWLLVLARVDVSLAYPFVGMGFIVTMLLAWGIQGETLTTARIAGTLMIAAGVVLLARD